jgi:hypothetical protein
MTGRSVRSREPGEEMSCLELATLPSAPFWARRYTKAALHAWQLLPDIVDTAELLVSEMVTNAISAARAAGGQEPDPGPDDVERICLTLRLLPGRVVLEVFDRSQAPPVLTAAGPDSESGRGLMLIDVLSKEWGHFFPPSGGKVVFAVIGTPPGGHDEPVTEDCDDRNR